MKVAIVTPTIGTPHLKKCIASVEAQDYKNIKHYLFIDGASNYSSVDSIPMGKNVLKVNLQENTGSEGWLGHRIYASCSFLVSADVICYLDEDNWLEPNHVSSLVEKIKEGKDWAFSLRKIYNKEGSYVCNDDCESLGKWPVYTNKDSFHIDTSCYAVKMEVALKIGHTWCKKWDADRQFFTNIRHYFPNFDCTGNYSLCYRLGGNENSVKKEFFEIGNSFYSKNYKTFPWRSIDLA